MALGRGAQQVDTCVPDRLGRATQEFAGHLRILLVDVDQAATIVVRT